MPDEIAIHTKDSGGPCDVYIADKCDNDVLLEDDTFHIWHTLSSRHSSLLLKDTQIKKKTILAILR